MSAPTGRERPILFSGAMVRAILSGTKTQTRRIVKGFALEWLNDAGFTPAFTAHRDNHLCPYGVPGDRLFVRENGWQRPERTPKMMREGADTWARYYYDADGLDEQDALEFKALGLKRRPSIHMPRWASRITLEITDVRVERLQDISEEDAKAEGVSPPPAGTDDDGAHFDAGTYRCGYRALWEQINGPGSWAMNPWVWAITFKRMT